MITKGNLHLLEVNTPVKLHPELPMDHPQLEMLMKLQELPRGPLGLNGLGRGSPSVTGARVLVICKTPVEGLHLHLLEEGHLLAGGQIRETN